MSGYGSSAPTAAAKVRNSLSIPFLVLSVVVAGIGLFLLLLWLITFDWRYFIGVVMVFVGGLMLFSRRAGSDRAE